MARTFKPQLSLVPYLQVPENRLELAYKWYAREPNYADNFAAFSYWLERCIEESHY